MGTQWEQWKEERILTCERQEERERERKHVCIWHLQGWVWEGGEIIIILIIYNKEILYEQP